ncbi:MAG TPA: cation:proton antiporter [Allosphingosinicella sp.]|nr:cation:proton antiporter [Allosphingosinicella sp.]
MGTTEIFLLAMLLIFTLPWLIWRLGRTDYYAPLVVVQMIVGILLGPGVFGHAFPDQYAFLFTPDVVSALNGIALWAVMIFVWLAGIELDVSDAWRKRRETGIAAGLALVVPLALGAGAGAVLLASSDGWTGPGGQPWQVLAGIGMACAVTAMPLLVLFLDKLEMLRTPLGQRILRYGGLDDIAIWAVLALILVDWERMGRQAAFVPAFAAAALAIRWLMPRLGERDRWFVGLAWLAAASLAADWAGLHYMVGAFIAGVVLDAHWFDHKRLDDFRDAILIALMPVYFLSSGLRTDWSDGGLGVAGAAVLLLAAAVLGKLAGIGLAGRILKWEKGEAWIVGWLLQTKGLVMIVFANILLDKTIITGATFTGLLLMAIVSNMLTTPMVQPRLDRQKHLLKQGG